MSTEKHTPTPWIWEDLGIGEEPGGKVCIQGGGEGYYIAELLQGRTMLRAEVEANAAFIVRACNSHAALVKALEKCHAALRQFAVHKDEKEAMDEARAALKLAKEA